MKTISYNIKSIISKRNWEILSQILRPYKTSDLLDNLNVVSGANLRLNTDDVIQNQERQLNAAKRSILRMLGNILKHIFLSHVKYGCKTFQPWTFQPHTFQPYIFLVYPSMFILF